MIFKLIIIFMVSGGDVGVNIGPLMSWDQCIKSAKASPAFLATKKAKLISAVCVPPENIRVSPNVST
jgi:hypothetical protein